MNKVPTWFYVVAGVALVWNLLGALAVIMNFLITPEQIASLPAEQQQMYADTPNWSGYASLVAVISGSLACLALLLKKAWAKPLFLLSIVGLIIQNISIFFITDAVSVLGLSVLFMQSMVFIIAIGLLLLAQHAIKNEWIS